MTLEKLDNLVKIKQLKVEPPDQNEFDNMVTSAKSRLQDSQVEGLSEGHLEITPQLLQELINVIEDLLKLVAALGPINKEIAGRPI